MYFKNNKNLYAFFFKKKKREMLHFSIFFFKKIGLWIIYHNLTWDCDTLFGDQIFEEKFKNFNISGKKKKKKQLEKKC
jgi:hypothetical protein